MSDHADTIRRALQAISPAGITGTEGPAALAALDALLAENQQLREGQTDLAMDVRALEADNQRLRDALERIATSHAGFPCGILARAALAAVRVEDE